MRVFEPVVDILKQQARFAYGRFSDYDVLKYVLVANNSAAIRLVLRIDTCLLALHFYYFIFVLIINKIIIFDIS